MISKEGEIVEDCVITEEQSIESESAEEPATPVS